VLDTFNRPDGMLGGSASWLVQNLLYSIASNQLVAAAGGAGVSGTILWAPGFAQNQEVFVTIQKASVNNMEFELLLKGQSAGIDNCDALAVAYHVPNLELIACTSNSSMVLGSSVSVSFVPGDKLGARALEDGTVQAFKNNALIATWDASSWPGHATGGRIGLETSGIAVPAIFDDFGGGTYSP
jgi:hypothetical protein